MSDLETIDRLWARGVKVPVETLEDLDRLDVDEIVQGYRDYRLDDPEPGNNRSRAYWHGWMNRKEDSENGPPSASGMRLVQAMRQRGDFDELFKTAERRAREG